MRIGELISAKLQAAFTPVLIEVVDESEKHRGHAGHREEGESHFHVILRAPLFAEMSRIERHRAVHAALGAELVGRIHALSLDLGA